MNSTSERDAEARRVGRTYAAYRRSRRRRRAWAADNPGNRAIREELLAAVFEEAGAELASGGQVLDVGCGTGFWLEALQASGIDANRVVGVDVLPERVAAAAERVAGATVRQADARALPFEDGEFSVVLMFTLLSSLERSTDGRRALSEARRVLEPQGTLLCYEPRFTHPLNAHTRRTRADEFEVAGIAPRTERRLTVFPPLARRLGERTDLLYPWLVRRHLLRTHRLVIYRQDHRRAASH